MFLAFVAMLSSRGPEIRVSDLGSLRAAVVHARPGTRILIAPGDYAGGVYATDIHGTAETPISLSAADHLHPPKFTGAFQFEAVSYLNIRDIDIVGVSGNAIGIDDMGVREKPANHIKLTDLHIKDVPGDGSNGIKMAGVDNFEIRACSVDHWGGCAIDMVGCHHGLIDGCRFTKGGGLGVQAKGASLDVKIRMCTFTDYGGRGVNIGGSTGLPYYRPALDHFPVGTRYEAKDILVESCIFNGGDAPIAFAGADGGIVRHNTIINPGKWVMRILQETSTPDFVPCRSGKFEDNIVVFQSDHWFEGGVNIGPNTSPQSFLFARNCWYCSDKPDKSQPTLPTAETNGKVGKNPMIPAQGVKISISNSATGSKPEELNSPQERGQ